MESALPTLPKSNTISLEFQGGFVGVACKQPKVTIKPNAAKRGAVNSYSPRSRHRILKMFSKLEWSHRKAIFVTLTYPSNYPDPRTAKKHLRAFLKRVARRFHAPGNKYAAIWRLEFQERGAPHFHVIFVDLPFIPKEEIQRYWGEIIGFDRPFTRIEFCSSKRKTMYYVSKYLAKTKADERSNSGFIYMPYQAAMPFDEVSEDSIGRFWGIENADYLPFAERIFIQVLNLFDTLAEFKRSARHVFAKISDNRYRGFTLFVSNASRWLELWRFTLSQSLELDFECVSIA